MRLRIILSLMMCLGGLFAAQAQDVGDVPMGEIGDPQAGFEYAHSTCAGCHAVGEEQSPNRNAPRFKDGQHTGDDSHSLDGVAPRSASSNDAKYRHSGTRTPKFDRLHPEPERLSFSSRLGERADPR
jgi:cytochrome c553